MADITLDQGSRRGVQSKCTPKNSNHLSVMARIQSSVESHSLKGSFHDAAL